jgi:alpha-L-arabinofuranosidase
MVRRPEDGSCELEPFIQDALDEIEYVTGDASTKWGSARVKDGHPEPFSLHYVEIGNEDELPALANALDFDKLHRFHCHWTISTEWPSRTAMYDGLHVTLVLGAASRFRNYS